MQRFLVLVNGGWSAWTSWSLCDVPCGSGNRTRSRKCDSPAPDMNGQQCTLTKRGNLTNDKGLVEEMSEKCDTGIKCTR